MIGRKVAKVKEWVNAIQLVCPYCKTVQTESTALHVIHSPPRNWDCEKCNKRFDVYTTWMRIKVKLGRKK